MPPATAGWQQWAGKRQPQIAIHRTVSRLFFFFLSPYLWWENNQTTPACWKTYWNYIAFELRTVCRVFLFCFVFCVLFYFMCLLWWDNYRTTSEAPSPGLEAETDTKIIKTETSLHLNLEGFFNFLFFILFYFILFIYFFLSFTYFLFLFLSLFFLFFIFNPLSVSNTFSAYGWLVHCLCQFISLKLLLFVSLFCFFSFYLNIYFSLFL
jgi:hypothetical protein